MRVLMVSPYPPMTGGIAVYGAQVAANLREQGHEVTVASPEPSDAEYVIDVTRRGAGRALARLAKRCDRLVVQFQPEMLGAPDSSRVARLRSLLRAGWGLRAAPSLEMYVHEVGYPEGPAAPLLRRVLGSFFGLADEVTVHTELERRDFTEAFGIGTDRVRVVSQGEYLLRRTDTDQATARVALGVPEDSVLLLAIGFLQPNKGFDRAVRAFAEARPDRGLLYVVGGMWREDETSREHLVELRRLASETPGVELREGYVDDEAFDRWIVASDVLVLPYRAGWSSNVMERGLLYEKPVIMSRVGGMAEQGAGRPNVTLVDDDFGLVEALRRIGD